MDFDTHSANVLDYVDAMIYPASKGGKPIARTMLCGSRAVLRERCRPDADWDVLVHVLYGEQVPDVRVRLIEAGFHRDVGYQEEPDDARVIFESWKKFVDGLGLINVILTRHPYVWGATRASTEICAALNLTRREDRVAVHQIIRDGFDRSMVKDCTDVGALLEREAATVVDIVGECWQ